MSHYPLPILDPEDAEPDEAMARIRHLIDVAETDLIGLTQPEREELHNLCREFSWLV